MEADTRGAWTEQCTCTSQRRAGACLQFAKIVNDLQPLSVANQFPNILGKRQFSFFLPSFQQQVWFPPFSIYLTGRQTKFDLIIEFQLLTNFSHSSTASWLNWIIDSRREESTQYFQGLQIFLCKKINISSLADKDGLSMHSSSGYAKQPFRNLFRKKLRKTLTFKTPGKARKSWKQAELENVTDMTDISV